MSPAPHPGSATFFPRSVYNTAMESVRTWELATNPAWRPITDADFVGYAILFGAAGLLVLLTVWTYLGNVRGTPKRVTTLIALRLLALLMAVIMAVRPAASLTEIPKLPSTLIVAIDSSESMSVKDEANYTRWQVIQKVLEQSKGVLEQLQNDQQVTVYLYHFAKDFDADTGKLTDDTKPDGKRTDFTKLLSKLYDRHQGERLLRGLIILSDGAHNGEGRPEIEVAKWRGIGCPVYNFVVGQASTVTNEKDISFTSINCDPSPVAIKSDLKVKGRLNAQGFVGNKQKVRLFIGEKKDPEATREFVLDKPTDNEIEFTVKAPDQPGEIKVRLELVDPPTNQVTKENDAIDTYLTVTKEGVRVLVISKDGWELRQIRNALATDKRIDYVEAVRSSESPGTAEDAQRFDLRSQRYDVIILGDVSARMLTAVRPSLLNEIRDLVKEKGVGLMMTGGAFSLSGTSGIPGAVGWRETAVAEVLPVKLFDAPREAVKEPTAIRPTKEGLQYYVTKLAADSKKNLTAWEQLNTGYTKLQGYNAMGTEKPGAAVYARANDAEKGPPLLVGQEIGNKGRTLAFAVSDTFLWTQPSADPTNRRSTFDLHTRFWKQAVLWLAHQDEIEGNCYVRPEYRRLVVGGEQSVKLGLRDKRGDEVENADLRYQLLGPGDEPDKSKAKKADRDAKGGATVRFDVKNVGEYTIVAWGEGKDPTGEAIAGDAKARYMVYPDISDEMLQPAARPDFLLLLENTANGTALDAVRRADRLPAFLEELKANPPKQSSPKPKPYPEWRRDKQTWFLPILLLIFVAILGSEWGLRRYWGLV
jgi:uncharacterized membrane protein